MALGGFAIGFTLIDLCEAIFVGVFLLEACGVLDFTSFFGKRDL